MQPTFTGLLNRFAAFNGERATEVFNLTDQPNVSEVKIVSDKCSLKLRLIRYEMNRRTLNTQDLLGDLCFLNLCVPNDLDHYLVTVKRIDERCSNLLENLPPRKN